jgi:hypothetical protein
MELGFDTIGNATLIAYDGGPVLVTDPWIEGTAYFGSWSHSHVILPGQHEAARSAQFVWFSHGHPDHLNPDSLGLFRDNQILLPDHVGGRIASQLRADGFNVQILRDNTWTRLSDRIRVLCIADYNQDAILLIDIGGCLVVDLNDAHDKGWGPLVKQVVRKYSRSFLLRLSGFGDADMINFVDEDGNRLPSIPQIRKDSGFAVGAAAARNAETFGVTHFVPFSSLHRYQRSDSVWANAYTTSLEDYARGFSSPRVTLLPAFIRYDCEKDDVEELSPPEVSHVTLEPGVFGDDWSEELERSDVEVLRRYFTSIHHMASHLDFVNLRVGGRDNVIDLGNSHVGRGVTFEVPRNSLMQAVKWEIFDDLLIGNFMTTCLHGKWPQSRLYPDFTPYVTKYADNGLSRTEDELRRYFAEYRQRLGPFLYIRGLIEQRTRQVIAARFTVESPPFRLARRAYHRLNRASSRTPASSTASSSPPGRNDVTKEGIPGP